MAVAAGPILILLVAALITAPLHATQLIGATEQQMLTDLGLARAQGMGLAIAPEELADDRLQIS